MSACPLSLYAHPLLGQGITQKLEQRTSRRLSTTVESYRKHVARRDGGVVVEDGQGQDHQGSDGGCNSIGLFMTQLSSCSAHLTLHPRVCGRADSMLLAVQVLSGQREGRE